MKEQINGTVGIVVTYYDSNGQWVSAQTGTNIQLNVPSRATKMNIQLRIATNDDVTGTILHPMICENRNDTYEPYNGQTVTIDLGDTRYGGVLDVPTGVLTVDRGIVYLKDLSWTLNTVGANTFNSSIPLRKTYASYNVSQREKNTSDTYLLWSSGTSTSDTNALMNKTNGFAYGNGNTNRNIYLKDSRASTVEEATALFTAENPYIVYELDTPQTYQLTPTEVKTLLGFNAVWADTGDVEEMAYRADTKLYIDGVYEEYQDDLADYASALAALG